MADDAEIFAEATRLSRSGRTFALAGIVAASGSTPRASARMLVRADSTTLGTIGGGLLESRVIADALACIASRRPKVLRYDLDSCSGRDSVGMLCGGSMEVFIDVVPPRRRLLIVGAGHVGLALARLASFAGPAVSVVDERLEMVSKERFPMAEALYSGSDLIEALKKVPADPDDAVVIATHADDERALRAVLQRTWRYCGMLGSRRKIKILFEKLKGEGIDPELLAKVRAPIGLDIGAETPEEIAISILAEILADDTSTSCKHLAEALRS